jgi:hypothetical protein
MRGFGALLLIGLVACDATDPAGPGAPASLGALMPQVQQNGTDIIAHPKVMVISYADDGSNGSACELAASELAASPAWNDLTVEYGVVDLAVTAPQQIAGDIPATLSDSTLNAMLGSNLGDGASWGAPDPSTIYEFVIPSTTAYDDASGSGVPCCGTNGYAGYHYNAVVGSADVPYAVLCECPDVPPGSDAFGGETSLQQLTATLAHQTVDAATDPRTDANGNPTGYAYVQGDDVAWEFGTDIELADMCQYAQTQLWTDAPGMTYAIQRSWSNAAAAMGVDPCVGDGAAPYYQTMPDAPDEDSIMVTVDGAPPYPVTTHLDKIAVGSTATVTMQVYASDPTVGPFSVSVFDLSNETPPLLDITGPFGTFMPGDAVTFQVKVNHANAALFSATAEPYVIVTAPANGSGVGPQTFSYGLIGQ